MPIHDFTTSRRGFLAGIGAAGAALALDACSSSSGSGRSAASATSGSGSSVSADLTKMAVALSYLPNVEYGGMWIAEDEGYYRDAGVTPTFLPGGPNAPAPEVSLSSGDSVVATEANTVRMFTYLSKRQDQVLIGQIYQVSPNGFLSLAKRPVCTPEELHGAKVLAASANRPNIAALMKVNGVSDYSFVPAGTDVGPLLAGQGDALLAFSNNQPITLEEQYHMTEGKDFYFTLFSDLNFYLLSDTIIVERSYLESHHDTVVDFMKATAQGWQGFVKTPELAARLAVTKYGKSLGLDLAQQDASAEAEVPLVQTAYTRKKGILSLDMDELEDKVYPAMRAAGLTNLPDISKVVDTSVLSEVYKDGLTL